MADQSTARAEHHLSHVLESGMLGQARDLIRGLNVAIKTARIHDLRNEAVVGALDALSVVTNDLLRMGGVFTLRVLGDYLFLNDTRIKADVGSYAAFDSMCRELKARGIGSITVQGVVQRDDLMALVSVLNSAPQRATDEGTHVSEEAWTFLNVRLAGMTSSFELGPWKPSEISDFEKEQIDNKERAKKTFFRAVAVTRAVMSQTKVSQQMDLRRAKRVVQTMVDLLMEEEFSLLGLTTLKEYDNYTFFHSVNVCVLSIAIGKRLGLDKKRLSELGVAALLHDIGKTEIPTTVLRKPGKFDKEEWEMMKAHPALGVRVLVRLKGFSDLAIKAIVVAFEHHLGVNLQGYPALLLPRQPHLFSRIVTVADCFDAMTTQRVYSESARPRDKAMSYMLSQSGKLFDPTILKYFVNLIGVYPIGSLVKLSTGQIGVVMYTAPDCEDPTRPTVKVITDANGIEIDGPLVDMMAGGPAADPPFTIVEALDPARVDIDTSRYFL